MTETCYVQNFKRLSLKLLILKGLKVTGPPRPPNNATSNYAPNNRVK